MSQIIANFQFIRPLFLLAIIPVLLVYLFNLKYSQKQNLWQQLLPYHLYQRLVISKGLKTSNRFIHIVMLTWLIALIALAGPSWEKLPQSVYQSQTGKVLLMDMSMSMRATDLSPNRLTRARFKAVDLINQIKEGETGLIAYAGDAFVISPLTDDANTLISLIPSLSPEIMPTQGSSALMGLEKAAELLENAGYQNGQIYWLTDGILRDEISDIRDFIQQSPYTLSALLIGTEEGAPIKLADGKLLKDYTGNIVVPSINSRYMEQALGTTSANYSLFSSDNSDILALQQKLSFQEQQQAKEVENTKGDTNKDMGPYLVLLILPVVVYAFRKGVLVCAFLLVYAGAPNPSFAQQAMNTEPPTEGNAVTTADTSNYQESLLDKWFKNADQRGKRAYDNQAFETANELFEDKQWRAASAYKQGDFEKASELYAELDGVENQYNYANSLAKQGKLEDAIEAYNRVLSTESSHSEANKNKKIVESLLEQQEQQQDQQQNQQNDPNQESSDDEQQDGQQGQDDQQSQEQSDQQQSSDSESSQQNESEENKQEQNQSSSSQDSDEQQEQQDQQQDEQRQDDSDLSEQAQQQREKQEQQEQSQQQNQASDEQSPENELEPAEMQQAIANNAVDMDELSPEEKEQMQRMQMIMNKVPDDPAYLLQRKMQLEAARRNTPPPPTQENW